MKKLLILLISFAGFFFCSNTVLAAEDYIADYESILYNTDTGLSSLEINAIAQTPDGYIWAGSYSGLYRYDGSHFSFMKLEPNINNVMALYTDSLGRLWIGTNDRGVACYEPSSQKITFFSTKNGLSSDSIRCIGEDNKQNIYVGTAGALASISPGGKIVNYNSLSNITCVTSISFSSDGTLAGTTNSGHLFFMKNGRLLYRLSCEMEEGVYFNTVYADANGSFLVGTSSETVYSCSVTENGAEFSVYGTTPGISSVNHLLPDTLHNGYFICAENGLGYLDSQGNFTNMNTESFNNSISDILYDYQGNIWFVSNKQGIRKLSKNPFSDLFKKAGLENHVVNATLEVDGLTYAACDDGLFVMDSDSGHLMQYDFLKAFEGVRIRHIMKDSRNNIWVSTYSADGLICIDPNQQLTCYNESTAGTMGGRFRSTLELSDHTILAASSTGLSFIENGTVTAVLGEKEGLTTPQILSLVEQEDGTILAGSDGDGIYKIKDKKIIGHIGPEEGLDSLVVLRIVKCTGGYIYITSSALYYDQNGSITELDSFPYTNNYDIYFSQDGYAWVSSSAGIYIVKESDLLANKDYNYVLLNQNMGFDTTLTANSWNYVDEDSNYFLCCSTGVRKISIPDYNLFNNNYKLTISDIRVDGNVSLNSVHGTYKIPPNTNRFVIVPSVLNYTLSNLVIHMYLEGFDDTGITIYQNELTEMSFTNLPYGNYNFHIQVLNGLTREIEREVIIPIQKEAQFFEHTFFKVYMIAVLCFVIIFFTWLLSKFSSITVIKRQYEEIRLAKEEADHANHAKSQFLANMSHEIRTPINTIMGMDELILREDISPLIRGYAKDIQNASTSLLSIVNDILDFSKIESGKMNIVEQEYSTKQLFKELTVMLHVKSKEKKLKPIVMIDKNIPNKLYGDDTRIKQIILNLLSNAVKYTDSGSVTFTVNLDSIADGKAYLSIQVKDSGIGIREEDMDKLFQTFERLDEKRNAHIQGTGLGLNITKELLSMMGSELKVESEYGHGSNFHFVLCQSIVDAESIGEITNTSIKDAKSTAYMPKFHAPEACILVIDDTLVNLEVVKGLLKSTEIQIDTGASGRECLEHIRNKHYDLILLDHMMPEMDGLETLEHIRQEEHLCKDTPVIVLTANAIVGAKEMYIEKGFTDYLAKPITGDALETTLLSYLPSEKTNRTGN